VELLAAFLDGLGDGGADAAAFVAQQGEQADGGAAQLLGDVQERRDVQRGEDHRQAAMTTTRGQTTCQGLMSRFISDIQ
jgi:hypothetical protein